MKCQLCEREVLEIEFHHFYPGKKRRIDNSGIDVCIQCGDISLHNYIYDKNVLC